MFIKLTTAFNTCGCDRQLHYFRRDKKNSIFLHCTLLQQPYMPIAACVNQPLIIRSDAGRLFEYSNFYYLHEVPSLYATVLKGQKTTKLTAQASSNQLIRV